MKKLTMWYMIVFLSFILTGCGKCKHEYDSGMITKEATCIEEGEKTFFCSLCGDTKVERVSVISHSYNEEVTKEPTFFEEGEKSIHVYIADYIIYKHYLF